MHRIVEVSSSGDMPKVSSLFREYANSLQIDLCFQNFEEELRSLPGSYRAPLGALFLAMVGENPVGCIALRPFSRQSGELKRLYVQPAFRGKGIARGLVGAAVKQAKLVGYQSLVLDTLTSMHPAISLYKWFGFQPTASYYSNPLPDVVYLRLEL